MPATTAAATATALHTHPHTHTEPISKALALKLATGSGPAPASPGGIGSMSLPVLHFEECARYQSAPPSSSSSSFVVLSLSKPLTTPQSPSSSSSGANATSASAGKDEKITLPTPKRVFFPVSEVRLGLKADRKIGAGMINVGNTCYLNSTLQALFHVPAFANWLSVETEHAESCHQNGGCILCGMKKTLHETQLNSGGTVKPWQVYSKLRLICRHLTPGNQEDAHEFLRYLIESMEKAYLSRFGQALKQLDQYSKETTPLNQILGGYLRSAVRCLYCGRVSTTFQHFQDLLVDARKANTLDEALDSFFSKERLEENCYNCETCNRKVSATKQFFIERAPMVLCIALKRFSAIGGKVTKHVPFKLRISMKKYMLNPNNANSHLNYRLVSVVTHLGASQNCGHYTAIGLGPGNTFYNFDDSSVRQLPTSGVLSNNAYILFYELERQTALANGSKPNDLFLPLKPSPPPKQDSNVQKPSFIGPILPDFMKVREDNGPKILSDKVNAESNTGGFKSILTNLKESDCNKMPKNPILKSPNGQNASSPSPIKQNGFGNGVKLNRSNSFNGIGAYPSSRPQSLPNGTSGSGDFESDKTDGDNKPKTVIGYCNSNSFKMNGGVKVKASGDEKENGSGKVVVNGNTVKVKSCLVPYDSESENQDDEDNEEQNDKFYKHQTVSNGNQGSDKLTVVTKATTQGWKVSTDGDASQLSPSLNGVVNNKVIRTSIENLNEPSDKEKDVASILKRYSHRGYGGQVKTWNETHSQMDKQVFEDKKNMLKRAAEADDDLDHGRMKKIRHNNYKFHNPPNNGYNNPFQNEQNHRIRWSHNNNGNAMSNNSNGGHSNKGRHFYGGGNRNFKYRPKHRFNYGYSRNHSNHNRHHHHYNRNR